MNPTLAVYLGELAETLHNLRRRLRQSARVEVARAVGEALREFARAMICGPVRYPANQRTDCAVWDQDPWQDDAYREPCADELADDEEAASDPLLLPPALVVGLAAARWAFSRSRQIGPALLFGLVVALVAGAGGPTVKALVETWSTAAELLHQPGSLRRP